MTASPIRTYMTGSDSTRIQIQPSGKCDSNQFDALHPLSAKNKKTLATVYSQGRACLTVAATRLLRQITLISVAWACNTTITRAPGLSLGSVRSDTLTRHGWLRLTSQYRYERPPGRHSLSLRTHCLRLMTCRQCISIGRQWISIGRQ